MNDQDLRAAADRVGLAIQAEEANAEELMRTADQFKGLPIADHLRALARERRIRGLELQGRLACLIAAIRATREQ